MHIKNVITVGLVVVVFVLMVAVAVVPVGAKRRSALGMAGSSNAPNINSDSLVAAQDLPAAPKFAEGTWINSERLTLESLRGRVVLVDFWTFGCYNCRKTLPSLKRLDARYRERGLTIIGVHSPEHDREKNIDSLRREIRTLGIPYAVVTDNDHETWSSYGIEAWPTVVILDKQGRIRWRHVGNGFLRGLLHVGKGLSDEQESVIKKLLDE